MIFFSRKEIGGFEINFVSIYYYYYYLKYKFNYILIETSTQKKLKFNDSVLQKLQKLKLILNISNFRVNK